MERSDSEGPFASYELLQVQLFKYLCGGYAILGKVGILLKPQLQQIPYIYGILVATSGGACAIGHILSLPCTKTVIGSAIALTCEGAVISETA